MGNLGVRKSSVLYNSTIVVGFVILKIWATSPGKLGYFSWKAGLLLMESCATSPGKLGLLLPQNWATSPGKLINISINSRPPKNIGKPVK
jgi:hypothetical protein